MVRPRKNRTVSVSPDVSYFKPRGIPLWNLQEVRLTIDELEAIRLSDSLGLSQEAAGQRMEVSRATFGRIIQNARKLVADALVNGKAIRIEGGTYRLSGGGRNFVCKSCHHKWAPTQSVESGSDCPKCNREHVPISEDQENENG